jgi:hypothetical protein
MKKKNIHFALNSLEEGYVLGGDKMQTQTA